MKKLLACLLCAALLAACGTLNQTTVTDTEGNTTNTTTYTPPTAEELQAQVTAAQVAVALAQQAIEAYNNADSAEERGEAEEAYQRQAFWLALANAWLASNGGETVEVPELKKGG